MQADLGGITGGQASLYWRAKASHEQITRMLESLQPLRLDAEFAVSQSCGAAGHGLTSFPQGQRQLSGLPRLSHRTRCSVHSSISG